MTLVQQTLGDWAPPLNPELSQFHTPVDLANRMVAWALADSGLYATKDRLRVLEPAAGGGNIVRALVAHGCEVVAIEIDDAWARVMRKDPTLTGAGILCTDFLGIAPTEFGRPFDLSVQNTPFEDGQDASWIVRALQFAHRVVALAPTSVLHGKKKHQILWSRHSLTGLVHLNERPVFIGDGGSFDCVIVEVTRGRGHPFARIERW